jgi:hypothetical protein
MLAQLLFLTFALLAIYLLRRVIDEGLAGPISKWWFYRSGKGREWELQQLKTKKRTLLEYKIEIPPMTAKEAFQKHLEEMPEVDSAEYKGWLVQAQVKLLQRTMEGLQIYRSGDELWRETYCKFTQNQASAKAWKDASLKKEMLDGELADIQEWAQTLKPGWEKEIFQTADKKLGEQMKQQHQQQQMQQLQHQQHQQQLQQMQRQYQHSQKNASKSNNQPALTPAQLAAQQKASDKIAAELIREEEQAKRAAAAAAKTATNHSETTSSSTTHTTTSGKGEQKRKKGN